MQYFKSFAKAILITIILGFVANVVIITYVYIDSSQIVDDRVSDLAYITAEENCLSQESGRYDGYKNLLRASETAWLKFRDDSITVCNESGTKTYYNYIDAPQRGSTIKCRLKGEVKIPLILLIPGMNSFTFEIEKEVTVMGLSFYKGK